MARTAGAAHPPDPPPAVDGAGYGTLFREGLAALGEMLGGRSARTSRRPVCRGRGGRSAGAIPDVLWTRVVLELAAAHRHATVSRDHLARAAVPLYLGRVASLGAELAGLDPRTADDRLEALCLTFERSRGELVALWTAPAR